MSNDKRAREFFEKALKKARDQVARDICEAKFRAGWYEVLLSRIQHHITEDGFALADLGTSQKELAELRIGDYKLKAVDHLEKIRRLYDYDRELRGLRDCLHHSGLSLADLGTSEEELTSLKGNYDELIRSYHN